MKKFTLMFSVALLLFTGASFAQEGKTGDTKQTVAAPKKGPNGKEAPAAKAKAAQEPPAADAAKGGKKGVEKVATPKQAK